MSYLFQITSRLPPSVLSLAGRLQTRSPLLRRVVRSRMPSGPVQIRHGMAKGLWIHATADSNVGYVLGTTEPQVQEFLAAHLKPGDVVYDIGANVGFFSLLAARLVGERGRVYAFEPLPTNVERLRKNVELNGFTNIEVIQAAVGEASGTAQLVIGESSLDARLDGYGAQGSRRIEVSLLALDEAELDRPPDLVKIDAEGAEWAVFAGMRSTLASAPVILCELHRQDTRSGHLSAVRAALGQHADAYDFDLLEEGEDWWAPHAVAIPALTPARL